MNIPPSPTVPINLTPNWANQSNAQYQQSRQERALQSFGPELQNLHIMQQRAEQEKLKEAQEDAIIPPSMEEMTPKDLDTYIDYVEQQTVLNGVDLEVKDEKVVTNPVAISQNISLRKSTKELTEEKLFKLTLKALKNEYKAIGGKKSTTNIMNKAKMVALILEHKGLADGTQTEKAKK